METNGTSGYFENLWDAAKLPFTLCSLGLLLSLLGLWIYLLPVCDTLIFFAGILVLFYIPGELLVNLSRIHFTHPLTLPVISLGTGSIVVPAFYRFFRLAGAPDLLTIGMFGLLLIIWGYQKIKNQPAKSFLTSFSRADIWACLFLLVVILGLLHLTHFSDVLLEKDGFQFRAHYMTESVYHLGLVNALTDSYPPPALYAAGNSDFASYHLNMHLQTELLVRLFGLESLHLVSFYMPLLYFALLVLIPLAFIREIGGSAISGAIGGLLIFGSDLSFLVIPLTDARPDVAWMTVTQGSIWSLFTLNGFLPALIALFVCIFMVRDYLERERWPKLLVFLLLVYAAFGFKSSMGLQIGIAGFLTGLLMTWIAADRRFGLSLAFASGCALWFIVLDLIFLRSSAGQNSVSFAPLNYFYKTFENLGVNNVALDWAMILLPVLWITGLGARVIVIPFLVSRLKTDKEVNWMLVFLISFFLLGYVVTELFFIGKSAGQNNSVWFYVQSLMAAWFILFMLLKQLEQKQLAYVVVVTLVLMVSAPSTVQFLTLRDSDQYVEFNQDASALIDYMRKTSPNSVFLAPVNENAPSLASNFAGRSSVLSAWVSFVTEEEGLSKRALDIETFFDYQTTNSERIKVLLRYGVDYVYGPGADLVFMQEMPNTRLELQSGELVLYSTPGY